MRRLGWLVLASVACAACTSPTDAPNAGRARTRSAPPVMQCGSDLPEGVDVYSGTGTVNWTQLAASGRSFAFIKASQGTYDTQSTFKADWTGAKAAGVLRSPYHFFDGTDDGVAQANAFLAELGSAGGLEIGDLPPLLDLECPTASTQAESSANCEYTGDSGWVAPAELTTRVFDWLDTVKAATGMTPIIYSYVAWFADTTVTDARLANYPLFIASYNPCATIPAPWTAATFWQYNDVGTVPGIAGTGDVDVDRFFGSAAALQGMTKQPIVVDPLVDAGVGDAADGDAGTGPKETGGHAGCQAGDAPSPWWLVGFAAIVVGIRTQRTRRAKPARSAAKRKRRKR